MTFKDLLVHVDSSERTETRLDLAVQLAAGFGGRLTGLFVESASLGPSLVARRNPGEMAKAAAQARDIFEAKVRAAGIPSEWWNVDGSEYSDVVGWTVQCCRYVDLSVFGQRPEQEGRVPDDLIEQVLLQSGRPVVVVPRIGFRGVIGRRVLVAWTGNRASARALNDALPFLERADEVTLLSIQRPSAATGDAPVPHVDAAAHLRAHGITARSEKILIDELGMADHVLNAASDLGADLTVMGAHATAGFPHLQPSEATTEILRSMTTAVLLSH